MSEEHVRGERAALAPGFPTRMYLEASYADRDEIRRCGARWDQRARRWYAPEGAEGALAQWVELAPLPELLPGEDRSFGSGLFVDLLPASCWFTDIRTGVTSYEWTRVRHLVFGRAGYACEVCGVVQRAEDLARMQAHERWHYDAEKRIQQLRRLICLCNRCHFATHFTDAESVHRDRVAFKHLRAVNQWSKRTTHNHVTEARRLCRERSKTEWIVDLKMLTDAGIAVVGPPTRRADRAGLLP